jgi:hypothetical protein
MVGFSLFSRCQSPAGAQRRDEFSRVFLVLAGLIRRPVTVYRHSFLYTIFEGNTLCSRTFAVRRVDLQPATVLNCQANAEPMFLVQRHRQVLSKCHAARCLGLL